MSSLVRGFRTFSLYAFSCILCLLDLPALRVGSPSNWGGIFGSRGHARFPLPSFLGKVEVHSLQRLVRCGIHSPSPETCLSLYLFVASCTHSAWHAATSGPGLYTHYLQRWFSVHRSPMVACQEAQGSGKWTGSGGICGL